MRSEMRATAERNGRRTTSIDQKLRKSSAAEAHTVQKGERGKPSSKSTETEVY